MAKIGYARVSSADQNLDRQLKQLDNVEKIFKSQLVEQVESAHN